MRIHIPKKKDCHLYYRVYDKVKIAKIEERSVKWIRREMSGSEYIIMGQEGALNKSTGYFKIKCKKRTVVREANVEDWIYYERKDKS